ncbi:hypothetical protein FLT15_09980 [Paenibacillus thiaminolyticus]|uniref:ArnT family glycosyltransferase n=1 Tax=Paenibacillus thiaminolyticus TaxID=49283 RepID=UPI0011626A94|nr:glycosyltransferase family 39 protein [Paenibacillus thiaminolyticus]NGP58684.1 hypothetical protein [Paenibacillus thiaminolyticus]
MKSQITTSITKLLLCLGGLIFLSMSAFSIRASLHAYDVIESLLLFIMIVGGMILLGFITMKYLTTKEYITILVVFSFAVRFIWIAIFQTPPVSDFKMMYDSAVNASNGIFDFVHNSYYESWPYQLGFTFYQSIIIKIFGEGLFTLKMLNVLFGAGTCILVYFIASKLFNEYSGRIAGLLYAFNLPGIFMSSVLTNQYIAIFLFSLALYLLILRYKHNTHLTFFGILIGVLLSLGNLMRPVGIIMLIAIIIFLLISNFLGKSKEDKVRTIKLTSLILVSYYLFFLVCSYSLILGGITDHTLSNRDPLWKVVLGLNADSNGGYSNADAELIQSLPIDERKAVEISLIKERISDKRVLSDLFIRKFYYMWGELDSAAFWSLGDLDRPDVYGSLQKYERHMFIVTVLFGTISMIYLLFNKSLFNKDNGYLLPLLFVIGYVLIHLVIEIQARYRFESVPFIIILSSFGIYKVNDWIGKRFTKRNEKNA